MTPLRKFLALSQRSQILLLQAFVLLCLVRLALGLLPFRQLNNLIQGVAWQRFERSMPIHKISIAQVIWAVTAAARYIPGRAKCLAIALTAQMLLRCYGYASDLRIGVAKTDSNELNAHAWIEHNGEVLIGAIPELFEMTRLPSLTTLSS